MNCYIVEDHEDMRIILKRTVKKNFHDTKVVGESDTAEQALTEIPQLEPDLVLVDISLPGMDGIELIRRIRPSFKSCCILVVTGHDIDIYQNDAKNAGADAIVSKGDISSLIKTIKKCYTEEI